MDLLIISNYWHFKNEKSSSRYASIAEMTSEAGIDTEVITSSFYHTSKNKRNKDTCGIKECGYKVTLIDEPGYKRNIDPMRIASHAVFAKNVISYLKKRKKPDVIYLFVPSLSLGKAVAKYAEENNIRLVIDVLDLWPEAFGMLLPFSTFSTKLLFSMKRDADYIYSRADEIVSVSETSLLRALRYNKKSKHPKAVYIGMNIDEYPRITSNRPDYPSPFTFAYIGMLGKSYDLHCAIDAMKILKDHGVENAKLLVMGDGPLQKEFESHAASAGILYEFTGRLPYEEMVQRLTAECDVALNVISHGSAANIINKHGDYLAAELPIINTQESKEFRNLVDTYKCGINCKNADAKSVAKAMMWLVKNPKARKQMGKNARRLAKEKFDRKTSYKEILKAIIGEKEDDDAVEVLLSAMHLDSWEYINTLNITTDVTVINQCDREDFDILQDNDRTIKFICTKERGLSKSRNMALRNAAHDICILCDNDVEYVPGYDKIIEDAYERYPDADVIVFFIKRDENAKPYTTKEGKLTRKTALKVFSPEISFRHSSLRKNDITFNEDFGAGTPNMMGEESIFLYECLRKELKVYYVPEKIADLRYEPSTWKQPERDEQFFKAKGACFYAMTGNLSSIMNLQFVIRKRKLYNMSPVKAFKFMEQGKKEYKRKRGEY